jgi:integrase
MKLKKRNGIYYLYEHRDNVRSLKTRDRELAGQLLKEAKEKARGEVVATHRKVKSMRLREFRACYIEYRTGLMYAGEIAPDTLRADDLALRRLESALGNIPIRQIWSRIEAFKTRMLTGAMDLEKRKNTINTYIRHLSSAFAWATVEDSTSGRPAYLDANPFAETRTRRIKFKGIRRLPKYVPREDIEAMRDFLRRSIVLNETRLLESSGLERFTLTKRLLSLRNMGLMMEFYLYTGLRVAELTRLHWEDVRLSEDLIHIREAKDAEERLVAIPPVLSGIIENMGPKDIGRIFNYSSGHVSRMFKSLARAAGLDESRTLKGLRHSYGTYAADAGVDLDVIQANMGHTSVKTTEIYKTVLVERQKRQAGKLDFSDRKEA